MVVLGIIKETVDKETRVSATPETVKKYIALGLDVVVEKGAGELSSISDKEYENAGGKIKSEIMQNSDIIIGVNALEKIDKLRQGTIVISFLVPTDKYDLIKKLKKNKITYFSMNLIPRITRAQKMDALSSQSNISGYKAVILGANQLGKIFPLLMTAAGTIKPAKVIVMGAGVAGLQAIATARRLGAQVEASDIRQAAKEQVESLGASFIEVKNDENSQDKGGYAKQASKEYLQRQAEEVKKRIKNADLVITTALIPGRKAPLLITDDMLKTMKKGSVIVDLAVEQGGNCEGNILGKTIEKHGVFIIGTPNLPGLVPVHATQMYAKNMQSYVEGLIRDKQIKINLEDEVYSKSVLTHKGEIMHKPTKEALTK
jgi:H+-translocating NAD(P) transhydrogenase subunit alpha